MENNKAKAATPSSDAATELGAHTPGPWALSHVYSSVAGWSRWEYQIHIGDEPLAEIPDRAPVAAANARLIAAAPDMLAALRGAMTLIDTMSWPEPPSGELGAVFTSRRTAVLAAIAKAVGDRESDPARSEGA